MWGLSFESKAIELNQATIPVVSTAWISQPPFPLLSGTVEHETTANKKTKRILVLNILLPPMVMVR
jgi:hypothetical protein